MVTQHQLIDAETGRVVVARLQLADTFWRRFRGLQFRPPLATDEGLLLKPCRSIHTHWIRFAIDVAMLDEHGTVLAIQSNVTPWRIATSVKGTGAVLETAAGVLEEQLHVGLRTAVKRIDSDS